MTEAVIHALGEQIRTRSRSLDRKKLEAICSEFAALPVLDTRPPEEILGYDEAGIPR